MRKLVKLQEALTHWRTKISTNSREWEDRNRALRSEKEIMSRHYGHLKSNMDNFRCVCLHTRACTCTHARTTHTHMRGHVI